MESKNIFGANLGELGDLVRHGGEPPYRARQIFEAIYSNRFLTLDDISSLPKSFRGWLASNDYVIMRPKISGKFQSHDGTIRYLVEMGDGETVETVWMPEGDDGEFGDGSEAGENLSPVDPFHRATICVSSQVGCAVNCQFCLTALLGVRRNLSAGEIVGQVLAVLDDRGVTPPRQRINLVFMGMGEPFLNYEYFMKAVLLLVEGVGIPDTRMTASTAGVVPKIAEFGREEVRPKLAISLNASNNEIRDQLMPINRKWNLDLLLRAAREFPLRSREKLTFEYVLLDGVNDCDDDARQLTALLRGMRAKVNLIALNPGPGIEYDTPDPERVLSFQKVLINAGVPAFIRRPRGRDIYAACGQLKRTVELVRLS